MVLHLIASNFFGGPERQILNHLGRATDRGFRIGLCVFAGQGMDVELGERAEKLGIPVFYLGGGGKIGLRDLLGLKDIVVKHGVSVVCTHGFKSDFYAYVVSRFTDARQVAFVRGDTSENLKISLYTLIDRMIVRRLDNIITLSRGQKLKLATLGVPEGRISIIGNAVDIEAIESAAAVPHGDLEGEERFLGGAPYILTVGRLSPEKGHAVMLDAMSEVLERHPGVNLVMIGEGQERKNLEDRIRRLGIAGRVFMPGFSRRVPYYIKRSVMLVNPSHSEGMPNVVLEARALKVPVVATDVGGVSEIMPPGKGGILVPPGDVSSLSEAILTLLDDSGLRASLAEEGYDEFQHGFDVMEQTSHLIKYYSSVREH